MPRLHHQQPLIRLFRLVIASLALLSFLGRSEAMPIFEGTTVYLIGDTLTVDLRVDSLFSARTRDAIASGMTTSIGYEFLLEPAGPSRSSRRGLTLRLDHDIWEGRYQVIRYSTHTDTLIADNLEDASRFCSALVGVRLVPLLEASAPFTLRVRSVVNPISPEQEVKTRKWLNLLERGSVLELFFSFAPTSDSHDWVEIARFRKSDLPTESSLAPQKRLDSGRGADPAVTDTSDSAESEAP